MGKQNEKGQMQLTVVQNYIQSKDYPEEYFLKLIRPRKTSYLEERKN